MQGTKAHIASISAMLARQSNTINRNKFKNFIRNSDSVVL